MTDQETSAADRLGAAGHRPLHGPTSRHVAVVARGSAPAAGAAHDAVGPASPQPATPGSGFYQVDEPTEGLALGQLAPELEGVVDDEIVGLRDLEGDPVSLGERRGKPVWVSFFASWCPPCQEEAPVLREAHRRYAPRGREWSR